MKFCVIGLGLFGYQVATGLAENGKKEVTAPSFGRACIACQAGRRGKATHGRSPARSGFNVLATTSTLLLHFQRKYVNYQRGNV